MCVAIWPWLYIPQLLDMSSYSMLYGSCHLGFLWSCLPIKQLLSLQGAYSGSKFRDMHPGRGPCNELFEEQLLSHWAFMMAICFWEATFGYKSYHLSDCYRLYIYSFFIWTKKRQKNVSALPAHKKILQHVGLEPVTLKLLVQGYTNWASWEWMLGAEGCYVSTATVQ